MTGSFYNNLVFQNLIFGILKYTSHILKWDDFMSILIFYIAIIQFKIKKSIKSYVIIS